MKFLFTQSYALNFLLCIGSRKDWTTNNLSYTIIFYILQEIIVLVWVDGYYNGLYVFIHVKLIFWLGMSFIIDTKIWDPYLQVLRSLKVTGLLTPLFSLYFFLFAKYFCKKNDHRQLYFFLEILNHYILGAKIFIIIDRHIYGIRAYKWQIGTDVDQAKVQLKIVEGKIGEDYVALDSNKMMSYKNCILWLFSKF